MNIFQKYLAKPTAKAIQTKPTKRAKVLMPRPSWFTLSDSLWEEYQVADQQTKLEILSMLRADDDLPF